MFVITREDDDDTMEESFYTVEDAIAAAKEYGDTIEPDMLYDVIRDEVDNTVMVVAYTPDQSGEYAAGDYVEIFTITEA